MVTALGQRGAFVARPVQPVTKSERGTATIHDLRTVEKTAQSWDPRVKLSCASHGPLAVVGLLFAVLVASFLCVNQNYPRWLHILCMQSVTSSV